MTTNHPAHGPVSLDRLHQISEILSKASAQSDGGNLGYAMADAVKVIDGAIAAFGAEPVAWKAGNRAFVTRVVAEMYACEIMTEIQPLYTAQPASVVPEGLLSAMEEVLRISDRDHEAWNKVRNGIASCRAAMLQAGNSPVTPDTWIPVSERMPERDVDVQVYCADKKEQMVGYMERHETEGWFRFASLPNGGGVYCKPTHWMPLPAAPQQEVKP
ncbi:TPA_asm: DUF551 domain-containing protein [Salmonella enterica subsp. enterica serovar Typhimurium]|nr:DUF551 domain-containing protein [Salmonella enterica]HAE3813908.1 DUF551 domain-containing protein [Salmonella enterica subsp. enterica serovar Typhimurium]HAE8638433.1 DUF551 domain-containing protein [Salmonella enterica subsp. enterica serovar Typhimurium]